MKKILLPIVAFAVVNSLQAQGLKTLIKKATTDSASGKPVLQNVLGPISGSKSLTASDVASGLKEALTQGVQKGTAQLSATDGFFKNAAVKILMPPEAQKVEQTLRKMGMNKEVDDAILSFNRAAEDASKTAAPIFVDAIKSMSITDAFGILKGTDTAATSYLKGKTTNSLSAAFKPIIDKSLEKVDATKYWNTLANAYNKVPFVKKVNTDIASYVTDKAVSGIFVQVAEEEKNIRKNPVAQTTELLKKVFGNK